MKERKYNVDLRGSSKNVNKIQENSSQLKSLVCWTKGEYTFVRNIVEKLCKSLPYLVASFELAQLRFINGGILWGGRGSDCFAEAWYLIQNIDKQRLTFAFCWVKRDITFPSTINYRLQSWLKLWKGHNFHLHLRRTLTITKWNQKIVQGKNHLRIFSTQLTHFNLTLTKLYQSIFPTFLDTERKHHKTWSYKISFKNQKPIQKMPKSVLETFYTFSTGFALLNPSQNEFATFLLSGKIAFWPSQERIKNHKWKKK